jgi:hypothetical protein
MQYNVLSHYCDHTLEILDSATVDLRWNLLDDPNNCLASEAHMNYTQYGEGTAPGTLIQFNTIYLYQSPTAGNEAFQIYTNGGGGNFVTPVRLTNNVAVDTAGEICEGHHGTTGADFPSHLTGSGTALNQNNHFAFSSAAVAHCTSSVGGAFPYYNGGGAGSNPGSFGTLAGDSIGWTNSGNVNMVTGAAVCSGPC